MEKSNVRREAESILNESLGIDSRNAVPYSQRPEYDRALEKTYLALLKEDRTELKKEFTKKAKEVAPDEEEDKEEIKESQERRLNTRKRVWVPNPSRMDRAKEAIKTMRHTAPFGVTAAAMTAASGAMAGYPKAGAVIGAVAGASLPVVDAIHKYNSTRTGMFKNIKEEIRNNLIQRLNSIECPEKLEEALNNLTQDQRELLGENLSSVFDTGPSNQDPTILARAGRNMNRPGTKFANSTRAPAPAARPAAAPAVRPVAAKPAPQAARPAPGGNLVAAKGGPNDPAGTYMLNKPAPQAAKPAVAPAPTAVAKPTAPAPTAATTSTGPRPISVAPAPTPVATRSPPPAMSIAPPAPAKQEPTSPPVTKKPEDKDFGSMAGFPMNEETKPAKMSLENMLRKHPPGTVAPKNTIKESFEDFLKTKLPSE